MGTFVVDNLCILMIFSFKYRHLIYSDFGDIFVFVALSQGLIIIVTETYDYVWQHIHQLLWCCTRFQPVTAAPVGFQVFSYFLLYFCSDFH